MWVKRVAARLNPSLAREFGRQLGGRFLACSRQIVDEVERSGVSLGDRVELLPNWVTGPPPLPGEARGPIRE